jgi:hypothetical protein
MSSRKETIAGTRDIGHRLAIGENEFVSTLARFGSISKDAAWRVFDYYKKHKLVKRDFVSGKWNVKHGAFLDRDVILKALGQSNTTRALRNPIKPKTRKVSRIKRNPRGNYTLAEKKSIRRHSRKAVKRMTHSVKKMVATAGRIKRLNRNPLSKKYIIEALVRDGMKLHYRFWTGEGNGQRALLTERTKAKAFVSRTDAAAVAKRLMPYCGSKIHSLRVVPQ